LLTSETAIDVPASAVSTSRFGPPIPEQETTSPRSLMTRRRAHHSIGLMALRAPTGSMTAEMSFLGLVG
jgi:hypothetical protein